MNYTYNDPYCLNIPLTKIDKIQIFGDYIIAILTVICLYIFTLLNVIPYWYTYLFLTGFLLTCPFEYIQPRIGWVYYYKCATYKIAPIKIMWIIHSIWDSLILFLLTFTTYLIWGSQIFQSFHYNVAFYVSFIGMVQEILLECYQTVWYYIPNKYNPTWAIIRGRNMTLQQWHWSILPIIYYIIIIHFIYPTYLNFS